MSLNSTMVRLKLLRAVVKDDDVILSQFHYGSIKTVDIVVLDEYDFRSQFHYGSIKTLYFDSKNMRIF